ncbi:MAG: ArsR/SmtB family transcription factor [Neoaquamicrobium sediminum]
MTQPDAFMAIADTNRRHLLEELRRGPKTVNELALGLPVSRPAVSQHLKVLLDTGLVSASSQGTRRIYAISNQGFLKLNFQTGTKRFMLTYKSFSINT